MFPVLFKIPIFGGVNINSYGVMVAMGFVCGIVWIYYESKRLGQDPSKMLDLVFYILVAAIVGSRIFHVAVSERAAFVADPTMIFKIWKGGLVFYGGLIASVAVGVFYIRRHKMPVLITMDIFAPAIALGHAVGRIGCFLAGCCYGREAPDGAWFGVIFPKDPNSFAPPGIALYPTQLMESAGEVLIFILLLVIRRYRRFDGQLIASYLIMYAVMRYVLEFFRGDAQRGFIVEPWLSTSQFVSLLIFAAGLFMYMRFRRGARKD